MRDTPWRSLVDMRDDDSIAVRIAAARKVRGLTQQELAAAASLSLSLLKKIETGQRAATNGTVASVARALRVPVTQLTGQPYDVDSADTHPVIEGLRGELLAFGLPPGEEPPAVEDLARRVELVAELRHAASYGRLGALLPDLLRDLRAAGAVAGGADAERLAAWTSRVWDVAAKYAHTLGFPDVAAAAATRMREAAVGSGDPLRIAVGDALLASYLMRSGRLAEAATITGRSLADLVTPTSDDPASAPAWSTLGYMHLQAAIVDARAGDAERAWDHHAEAAAAARHLPGDRNDYDRVFGPTNVGVWAVSLAVEVMDDRRAVQHATVRIPAGFAAARAGHYWVDVARGQLYAGRPEGSLHALLAGRAAAPQLVRHHPMARETLYALARAERRSSDTLRSLAAWVGLQD